MLTQFVFFNEQFIWVETVDNEDRNPTMGTLSHDDVF